MRPSAPTGPDFSHIRPLLLAMAAERSTERLLELVLERLADTNNIALVRIWLVGPGDLCSVCASRSACADDQSCLHLAGSALDPSGDLDDGCLALRGPRLPLKRSGPVEGVAGRGPELLTLDGRQPRMDWTRELGLGGACSQPLEQRGELLGSIEVFTYREVPAEGPEWLRVIADHAAAAIANSRAFEEIERLRNRLATENQRLQDQIDKVARPREIVGAGPAMEAVLEQVELVAPTRASVLVLGESGTGKELLAREVHARSDRAERPLVLVNCASVPRDLYESEFFGHAKGAFTGATEDRVGRFELADGGTLFLDEVGELPLEMQSKLLRVLQEGQYERVGDSTTRNVDVRIVAATNRDLQAEVAARTFREDLFYRLNVFPIRVPPLRERLGDVPLLAQHFAAEISAGLGRATPQLSEAAKANLVAYGWPGNVRELRNTIERAVILCRDGVLRFEGSLAGGSTSAASPGAVSGLGADPQRILRASELDALERSNLERALESAGGKISGPGGAAELLGMKAATLSSKVRRMGLRLGR